MAKYPLSARPREDSGKGVARKLRREGLIPAVLYGEERKSQLLVIEARNLESLFRTAGRGSHLVNLVVEGDSSAKCLALLREIQEHPIRGEVLHVDLMEVSLKKKIHLTVPVNLTGEPAGVKTEGGVLELLSRELNIECLPDNMPDEITVDVAALNIGDSLHVSDLSVEGVTFLTPVDTAVVMVARPTVIAEPEPAEGEEELAEGEEEAKEGEEPAAGEEGDKEQEKKD